MKRGEKAARNAVKLFLSNAELPVMLYSVVCVADSAARIAGRKRDLFGSLFDYEVLVPADYCMFWRRGYLTGADDQVYVVGTEQQREAESRRHSAPTPGVFDAGVDMGPGTCQIK